MTDWNPPTQLPDSIDPQTAPAERLPRPDTTLDPSLVGEYITFERCPRYFIFKCQDRQESGHFHRESFDEAFEPLNPLLSKAGTEFEEQVERKLEPLIARSEDFQSQDHSVESAREALCRECQTALESTRDGEDMTEAQPVILLQTPLKGHIGTWTVVGDADLMVIWPAEDGIRVRIIDIKSAKEEKTYHQIQTAIYTILFRQWVESRDDLSSNKVTIEGGVITRADDINNAGPDSIPRFSLPEREADARSLCQKGGPLHRLYFTELESASYTIEDKCAGCAYNEACHSDAVEGRELAMLGLSPSQQEILKRHDITTIDDLSKLRYEPRDEHRNPQAPESPDVYDKDTHNTLLNQPDIGTSLSELVERAHYFAGRLIKNAANLDTGNDAKLLSRPSYSSLPSDDPKDSSNIEYPANSLIRVYLNIQYDNLRDTLILASARITATASDTDPIRISELADPTPKDENEIQQVEQDTIERFIGRLGDGISAVFDGLDIEGSMCDSTALHFYIFSKDEQSNLFDTLERHKDSKKVAILKQLLDGRKGVDQPMLSTIRSTVRSRYGLRTPSPGLLHLYQQFGSAHHYTKPRYDWKYTPEPQGANDWADGETQVDLQQVFNRRLFATRVAYEIDDGDYSLLPETQSKSDGDGLYSSRARYGAEIPLGYLWAAGDRIDKAWVEEADEQIEYDKKTVDAFRFHDRDRQERKIESRDVQAVGRHFCDALEHIERDIDYKSHKLEKKPVDPEAIKSMCDDSRSTLKSEIKGQREVDADESGQPVGVTGSQSPSLADACLDYLHLNNEASQEERKSLLQKPIAERILSGQAVPLEITSVTQSEEEDENGVVVEGSLLYSLFDDPETVRQRCRKKGGHGASSGSWMVATPFDHKSGEDARNFKVARNPQATIQELDLDEGTVTFTANRYQIGGRFMLRHSGWTTDRGDAEDSDKVYLGEGRKFVLDPQLGDITSSRCATAIEQAASNHLYKIVEGLAGGTYNNEDAPTCNWSLAALPPSSALTDAINWIKKNYGPQSLPSGNQADFIEAYKSQIQLLQGPPGTGKTGGSEGPAIAARTVAAAESKQGLTALVTGPSNKSIDEVMEATVEVLEAYQADNETVDIESSVSLVRLTSGEPDPEAKLPLVEYVDYNSDTESVDEIRRRLRAQERKSSGGRGLSIKGGQMRFTNKSSEAAPNEQTIIFATPSRSWKLLQKIDTGEGEASTFADTELWDLLAVDEGSMMTVPKFLMAGAGLRPDGQVLVAGDHRQMPPVQKHEFDEERRESIRAWVPYLSVLDFFRVIDGDLRPVPDDHQEALCMKRDPDEVSIPMAQLEAGRRCPDTITQVLYDHIYRRDSLDYEAVDERENVGIIGENASAGVKAALSDDATMSLILYDDEQHGQTNPVEVAISQAIIKAVPSNVSTGLVTPHNAQRGTLTRYLSEEITQSDTVTTGDREDTMTEQPKSGSAPTIDTVERFQGDERELMIVSATVSDPSLIANEDKFLLSENRATVALSRVKNQLVVVVAESVIEHIPTDTELYEEASLWKKLAGYVGYTEHKKNPEWAGSLKQFTGKSGSELSINPDKTSVSIYTE